MLRENCANNMIKGTPARRLIVLEFPNQKCLKKMANPSVDLPVEVDLVSVYELTSFLIDAVDDEVREKKNWEIALENTKAYDVGTQMSLALTCPDKNGEQVVWPKIISLL
jgi:hypothetical protein